MTRPDDKRTLPLVVFIATGGTISSKVGTDGAYMPALLGVDLLAEVPGASEIARVEVIDSVKKLSFVLTVTDWLEIIRLILQALARNEVSAVIVAQGTALMEETAYLADVLIESDKCVVFTGAMLPINTPGYDGARNIRDSLRVAADPSSRNKGALVVMNGVVHAARDVLKTHKTAMDAFESLPPGPLGDVDLGGVRWLRPPRGRVHVGTDRVEQSVDLIKVTLGMSSQVVVDAVKRGAAGLVVEGFPGSGGVPLDVRNELEKVISRVRVVLTSRSPKGRILGTTGGPSGAAALLAMGAVNAGDLPAVKARILLMAALGDEGMRERIPALFERATEDLPGGATNVI